MMIDIKANKLYIIGTGGFASEVTEYILDIGYQIDGYFDIDDTNHKYYGYDAPYLGNEVDFMFKRGDNIVIAISDYKIRKRIYTNLKGKGLNFPNIIHKNTFISQSSIIGDGAILCPFVSITSNAKIGNNFQANIYSYVAHDCIIGDNVTFAPSVKCNGNVIVKDNVYMGTGTIIYQGKKDEPLVIGESVVIAAGSVVTKNIPDGMKVFGNPAIEFTRDNIKRRM